MKTLLLLFLTTMLSTILAQDAAAAGVLRRSLRIRIRQTPRGFPHGVRMVLRPRQGQCHQSAVQRLHKKEDLLLKLSPKTKNAPFSGTENGEVELREVELR